MFAAGSDCLRTRSLCGTNALSMVREPSPGRSRMQSREPEGASYGRAGGATAGMGGPRLVVASRSSTEATAGVSHRPSAVSQGLTRRVVDGWRRCARPVRSRAAPQ